MPLLNTADAVYLGEKPVDAMYLDEVLVWSAPPPAPLLDADTQAYLTATGLDPSHTAALDGLVTGLKSTGLWDKMVAVYPFVGGSAALHQWNLKDPRDADAAYRLTYNAPGTHTLAGGYQANLVHDQTFGWADTHLVPAGLFDPVSMHLSLYSLGALGNAPRCDMGNYNWGGGSGRFHLIVHYTSGEFYYSLGHTGVPAVGQPGPGNGSGMFLSSRTASNVETAYRNGVQIGVSNNGVTTLPPTPVLVGALNGYVRECSDLKFGFASIGAGLSAQDTADLYSVVQAYQTALGRQV